MVNRSIYLSNPLYNNSYYKVARLANSDISSKLIKRYTNFSKTIPKQLFPFINNRFKSKPKVSAILLTGSAAGVYTYNDINLQIFLNHNVEIFSKTYFSVLDETSSLFDRPVQLSYANPRNLTSYQYARFLHSKPLLWGHVPLMFKDELPSLFRKNIIDILNLPFQSPSNFYKATSRALLHACRYFYLISETTGSDFPKGLVPAIKTLYKMEEAYNFDKNTLLDIKSDMFTWYKAEQ